MIFQKTNKVIKILLGLDFLLLLLSVIFIKSQIFGLNFRQIHPIFGGILLLLGTIHILSHCLVKKKRK
jgi:hypothetical protein